MPVSHNRLITLKFGGNQAASRVFCLILFFAGQVTQFVNEISAFVTQLFSLWRDCLAGDGFIC